MQRGFFDRQQVDPDVIKLTNEELFIMSLKAFDVENDGIIIKISSKDGTQDSIDNMKVLVADLFKVGIKDSMFGTHPRKLFLDWREVDGKPVLHHLELKVTKAEVDEMDINRYLGREEEVFNPNARRFGR